MKEKRYLEYLDAHAKIQTGTYIDRVEVLENGLKYATSRLINDHYWNYAYNFDCSIEEVPSRINAIKKHADSLKKSAAIYFTPDSRPIDIKDLLPYKEMEAEIWMEYDVTKKTTNKNSDLNIEKISGSKPNDIFIDIFMDAYGSGSQDDPGYQGLPPEYIESLKNCTPNENVSVGHFIGWSNGKPIAISSIYCFQEYAGLYNVGTIHSGRRKGYGQDISISAIEYALNKNCTKIFLQTQSGSEVENMYSQLGFKSIFEGVFYTL